MTLSEYQQLTGRTNVDLGSAAINAAHLTLGIIGEWHEAHSEVRMYEFKGSSSVEKVTDEFADIMWYTSELANIFNLQLVVDKKIQMTKEEQNQASEDIFLLAEKFKKYLAYNKPIDIEWLSETLNRLSRVISYRIETMIGGYTFEEALDRNIAKLQKRFPEKFDATLAIQQNDMKQN